MHIDRAFSISLIHQIQLRLSFAELEHISTPIAMMTTIDIKQSDTKFYSSFS